jgi:hypothetical protein
MSSLTTNTPTPAAAHRANLLAEATVSAYIHEIAPRRRPPARAAAPGPCPSSPRTVGRRRLAPRVRVRPLASRRRAALELGA